MDRFLGRRQVSEFIGDVEADLHVEISRREEVKVDESVFDGYKETITSPNTSVEVVLIHPDNEDDGDEPVE